MYGFNYNMLSLMWPLFLIAFLWGIFWKGTALWHSVKRSNRGWFLALLIINTFGILEIVYLFGVCRLSWKQVIAPVTNKDHGHHQA